MNLELNGDGILFLREKKVKITIMCTIKTVSGHSKVSERISLKNKKYLYSLKPAQDSSYTRTVFSSSKSQIVRSQTSQDLAGILEEESEPIRHPYDGKAKSCARA